MHVITLSAFVDEIEKIAATRALKNVQRTLAQHGAEEADILARRYARKGAIKQTPQGSQIKSLGAGSEGRAVMTTGAKGMAGGGLNVRKSFDPTSMLSSDKMIDRKVEVLKTQPRNVARHFGERRIGGGRHHFNEYVDGKSGQKVLSGHASAAASAQLARNPRSALRKGYKAVRESVGDAKAVQKIQDKSSRKYKLHDVVTNPGNWKKTRSGQVKAIDFLPMKGKELRGLNRGFGKLQNNLTLTERVLLGQGKLKPSSEKKIRAVWEASGAPINPKGRVRVEAPVKETLGRLGPGSRQGKKFRGAKPGMKPLVSQPDLQARLARMRAKKEGR